MQLLHGCCCLATTASPEAAHGYARPVESLSLSASVCGGYTYQICHKYLSTPQIYARCDWWIEYWMWTYLYKGGQMLIFIFVVCSFLYIVGIYKDGKQSA